MAHRHSAHRAIQAQDVVINSTRELYPEIPTNPPPNAPHKASLHSLWSKSVSMQLLAHMQRKSAESMTAAVNR
jgi:hypothetical protein